MITASVTTAHSPDTWNNKWKTLQKLQQIKQNCCNSISDNCALTRSMRFFSSPISSGSDTSLLLLTDSTSRQPRKHTAVERTDNWLRLYTKKKKMSVLTIHHHHHHVAIPLQNVIAIMSRWKDYWFHASYQPHTISCSSSCW